MGALWPTNRDTPLLNRYDTRSFTKTLRSHRHNFSGLLRHHERSRYIQDVGQIINTAPTLSDQYDKRCRSLLPTVVNLRQQSCFLLWDSASHRLRVRVVGHQRDDKRFV